MAPIAGALMLGVGWATAMQMLALLVLFALPAAFLLKGGSLQAAPVGPKAVGLREAIRAALRNRGYLLLSAGFFVCECHVAFLATQLPGVMLRLELRNVLGGGRRPPRGRSRPPSSAG